MAEPRENDPVRAVCVGTEREVGPLAAALAPRMEVAVRAPTDCLGQTDPGAVHVFFNEFRHDLRECAQSLVARDIPTLYAPDGILEWRNCWEYPEGGSSQFAMRPVLCHKVACIGRSQARVLAAWGNHSRCEVVGMPRLDALVAAGRRPRAGAGPLRILVATANNPGFDAGQRRLALASLRDLDAWARTHDAVHDRPLQWTWRLTAGLDGQLTPTGRISDREREDIGVALGGADALITTPSTLQLEALLQGLPVALLDYHNRPHYVPAAWVIAAPGHVGAVVADLAQPPVARMDFQAQVLADALESAPTAADRLAELVTRMAAHARECRRRGQPLTFPPAMLPVQGDAGPGTVELDMLFSLPREFSDRDLAAAQAAAADGAARSRDLLARNALLEAELLRLGWIVPLSRAFPGPRKLARLWRRWRGQDDRS